MLTVEDSVLILLAAGKSQRFGGIRSKLDQELLGRPLGLHVAIALEEVAFKRRLAVIGDLDLDYAAQGFETIRNLDQDAGLSLSIRLGVARARALAARSVVIALADMPRVTAAHIHRLYDASGDDASIVASSDGRAAKPPALFGIAHFDRLMALDAPTGARDMIRGGRHVVASPAELIDVDTPDELARLRKLLRSVVATPS